MEGHVSTNGKLEVSQPRPDLRRADKEAKIFLYLFCQSVISCGARLQPEPKKLFVSSGSDWSQLGLHRPKRQCHKAVEYYDMHPKGLEAILCGTGPTSLQGWT